ncbi:MAG: HAD-IC family P-type ATPase [Micrococcales bacterium]
MSEMRGLTSQRAAELLKEHGENTTRVSKHKSTWALLLQQFQSPIILILIAATVISMFLGEIIDGLIILGILIPSGFLNYWQENRANQTMQELLKQLELSIAVLRDNKLQELPIRLLVPGDVIKLATGDLVPADCELLESQNLSIDESALTGETFAVEKSAQLDKAIHFGTHVVSGSGWASITATGLSTKYGELVNDLADRDVKTGFERGTTQFGLMLMRAMLLLGTALVIFNVIMQRPLIDSLLFSLALAVGLTPQLLPTIITVSLASGARVMAKNRVLVKRLDAIEDFGSMNVLCSDKTGTLTVGVTKLKATLDSTGKQSAAVAKLASLNSHLQSGFTNPLDD